ncbi:alkaline phosphatase family protein [Acholeplasma granularum]|uniref:alkaline phosphatase family protein n=1 Tax=Acholeplasma granularum TaxID=264635 RepID=UPI0004718DF5|nr:alkaline phosphatase family protein [Acholeplasma granularum]
MKKFLIAILLIISSIFLIGCKTDEPIDDDKTPPVEDTVYKGTFDREFPSYYEPGVPLIDDAHVVYINWDGFARYYLDEFFKDAVGKASPTLQKIMEEGVFFDKLESTFPFITNPLQNAIITGSTSAVTKNVYRYYDKTVNRVFQQTRENNNPTIVDVAVEAKLPVASVRFYLAENQLTSTDPSKIYITASSTEDHFVQLANLVTGKPVSTYSNPVVVPEIPRLTFFYISTLDGIGHNFESVDGYPKATTEEERMANILSALKEADKFLGDFIAKAKAAGVYDKLTFFFTTDHGMAPYGLLTPDESSDYGRSKIGDLQDALKRINSNYILEMVASDESPKPKTTVVGVGTNLNLQLTFRDGTIEAELQRIKTELLKEHYVGDVYTRAELIEHGYDVKDTDMIVVPSERYFFGSNPLSTFSARAQHDTTRPESKHIVGWIWGKGIKKNVIFDERAFNYDFGQTMAAALGLQIPNANGIVLDVFERDDKN